MGKRLADGTWKDSCLDKVAPKEPIFVLRAQDLSADGLVDLWAEMAAKRLGYDHPKIMEARACAAEMRDWPTRKDPD